LASLILVAAVSGSSLASEGGGEEALGTGPAVVKLKPFSAPVFRDGRVWGTLTLVLKLDVAEGVSLAEINHEMPRFQAETLNFLIRYGNTGAASKELMNLDFLMTQLQKLADRLFHRGRAKLLVHAASQARKR
jgi:hypothetical protein